MDSTQLATIAVTALVTTVIKELVTWFWALVKTTATASTTRARLSAMFNKTNRAVAGDIFALLFYTVVATRIVMASTPIERWEVAILVLCLIGAFVMSITLAMDLVKARRALEKQ